MLSLRQLYPGRHDLITSWKIGLLPLSAACEKLLPLDSPIDSVPKEQTWKQRSHSSNNSKYSNRPRLARYILLIKLCQISRHDIILRANLKAADIHGILRHDHRILLNTCSEMLSLWFISPFIQKTAGSLQGSVWVVGMQSSINY